MVELLEIPKRENLIDFYGNPEKEGRITNPLFREHHLTVFKFPFPMRLSWCKSKTVTRFLAHKKVGHVIIDALQEILLYKGYEYLRKNNFDLYGGVYCHRKIKGGNRLSTHSWGISIDINPHLGPCNWGAYKEGKYIDRQPDFIKQAFIKRGFVNLPWDTMHFQAMQR